MTDQTPQTTTEPVNAAYAAYGALWCMVTDNPVIHAARKHLLESIGGARSDGQREAIKWAGRNVVPPSDAEIAAIDTTPQPLAIGLDREAVMAVIDANKYETWTVDRCGQMADQILALAAPAEPLWMMHVRGPDDIYPAPDYETALAWSDYVNDVLAKAVPEVMTKAVPAIWNGTPEQHAERLPEAIKGWTLPAAPTGVRS